MFNKKTLISREEFNDITSKSVIAKELLEKEEYKFIVDFFNDNIAYAEKSILEDSIKEVREVVSVTDKLSRIFITPKKEQVNELVGRYKLCKSFIDFLKQFIQAAEDLNKAIAEDKVEIDDRKI